MGGKNTLKTMPTRGEDLTIMTSITGTHQLSKVSISVLTLTMFFQMPKKLMNIMDSQSIKLWLKSSIALRIRTLRIEISHLG